MRRRIARSVSIVSFAINVFFGLDFFGAVLPSSFNAVDRIILADFPAVSPGRNADRASSGRFERKRLVERCLCRIDFINLVSESRVVIAVSSVDDACGIQQLGSLHFVSLALNVIGRLLFGKRIELLLFCLNNLA